ncbi:MAG: M6 family metalloprotease domain-containing protein [Muribaculaceae bacterium]|nr:M6 family metalloprotease domain-containing protein [Muribaculaceae bacterium]
MKKLLTLVAGMLVSLSALAVPANPTPLVTAQPDGTQVTLRLHGDEFYSFTTTIDGYTVLRTSGGAWVYARRVDGRLQATDVMAHDAGQRTAAEQALIAGIQPGITDRPSVQNSKVARAQAQQPDRVRTMDLDKFHGLIILVEPSDVKFSMGENANKFYDEMVNTKNLQQISFGSYGTWTGSVRDYFYDNSVGEFDPHFDIVGPVQVSQKSTTFRNGSRAAFREALRKVEYMLDYTIYDGDSDGTVDNVCFVVAGYGSHTQGNNEGLLWPHESTGVGEGRYDGVRIDKYSCSTELGGGTGYGYVDGIGTFCHEFTHVLGFPDLYDTDYEQNGQSHDPGDWDIMSGGSYLNRSRTPAGYGIFERYALGFASPRYITGEGAYSLKPLSESNDGLILRTPQNKEYFIMENRQKTSKWDAYLPGHGMLVTRVDSTTAYLWTTNKVNCNPEHMYYELLRAGNTSSGSRASDPFPGSTGVPVLSNYTEPNLVTWSGKENSYSIIDITETGGVVNFLVEKAGEETSLYESFNKIPMTTTTTTEAQGDIATWKLSLCNMVKIDGRNRAVEMKNPSVVQMLTPVYCNVTMVSFMANNTSGDAAKLALQYSVDGGSKWTNAKTYTGATYYNVPGSTSQYVYWNVKLTNDKPVQFRIQMTAGSKTAPCQIDDFEIYYTGEIGGPSHERGDVDGNGVVDVDDLNIIINIMLRKANASDYPAADVNNDGSVDVDDMNIVVNIMVGKE